MQKYLASFLLEQAMLKSSNFSDYASFSLEKLTRTVHYGNRNMVPSLSELNYIKVGISEYL